MENVKEGVVSGSSVDVAVKGDSVFELSKVASVSTGILALTVGVWAVLCIGSAFIQVSPAVLLTGLLGAI